MSERGNRGRINVYKMKTLEKIKKRSIKKRLMVLKKNIKILDFISKMYATSTDKIQSRTESRFTSGTPF